MVASHLWEKFKNPLLFSATPTGIRTYIEEKVKSDVYTCERCGSIALVSLNAGSPETLNEKEFHFDGEHCDVLMTEKVLKS